MSSTPPDLECDVALSLALPPGHEKQHAVAASLARIGDALIDVGRSAHRLVSDAGDDITGTEPFVGRFAVGVDCGHHHARDVVVDTELFTGHRIELLHSHTQSCRYSGVAVALVSALPCVWRGPFGARELCLIARIDDGGERAPRSIAQHREIGAVADHEAGHFTGKVAVIVDL